LESLLDIKYFAADLDYMSSEFFSWSIIGLGGELMRGL